MPSCPACSLASRVDLLAVTLSSGAAAPSWRRGGLFFVGAGRALPVSGTLKTGSILGVRDTMTAAERADEAKGVRPGAKVQGQGGRSAGRNIDPFPRPATTPDDPGGERFYLGRPCSRTRRVVPCQHGARPEGVPRSAERDGPGNWFLPAGKETCLHPIRGWGTRFRGCRAEKRGRSGNNTQPRRTWDVQETSRTQGGVPSAGTRTFVRLVPRRAGDLRIPSTTAGNQWLVPAGFLTTAGLGVPQGRANVKLVPPRTRPWLG